MGAFLHNVSALLAVIHPPFLSVLPSPVVKLQAVHSVMLLFLEFLYPSVFSVLMSKAYFQH